MQPIKKIPLMINKIIIEFNEYNDSFNPFYYQIFPKTLKIEFITHLTKYNFKYENKKNSIIKKMKNIYTNITFIEI